MTSACKIGIVDDHQLFVDGLKSLITEMNDFEVISCVYSGEEIVRLITCGLKPDIIILDIMMSGANGIETGKKIRKLLPECAIIICSMYTIHEFQKELSELKPEAQLSKFISAAELEEALHHVFNGLTYYSHNVVGGMSNGIDLNNPNIENITKREKEIIHYLKLGYSAKMIADLVNISPNTVNNHKANIYEKLNLKNVSQLIYFANKTGL